MTQPGSPDYGTTTMKPCCACARSWLLLLLTVAGLALGWVGLSWLNAPSETAAKNEPARPKPAAKGVLVKSWPMFGGTPQRNMVNTVETNIADEWKVGDPNKNIKWTAKVGTKGYGGPVVAGGKIYVGTNNDVPRDPKVTTPKAILMCFREADGKFLWQLAHDMPSAEVAREAIRDGLCATPTIDGDRLYYVTPACEMICASTDGKIVWSFDMMTKLKVYPCYVGNCAPVVVGDMIYAITGNGRDLENNLPSPKAPNFVAFTRNGKLAWRDSLTIEILEGQWANPAYAVVKGKGQVIFPGGDGWLYALDPKNGKLIWKFDCNPKDAVWPKGARKGTRNYIIATPVVFEDKVYIANGLYPDHPQGSGAGHFWCVDLTRTGDVSPELVVDATAKPVKTKLNPNSALVWHFGGEIRPRPMDGREVYMGRSISTCAIHGGLVYIPDYEGYLHCLDVKTGMKYWEHDFKSAIWGSPYWVDKKIYIGNEDGDVVVFTPGKVKAAREPNEMGESVLSTPVAANGVLYILTKSKLFAIEKKK
jgi:outer membrane protein assembly factor BamB